MKDNKKYLFGLIEKFTYRVGQFHNDPNPIKHTHYTLQLGRLSIIWKVND